MSVAWKDMCLCLSCLCYFGDVFVMQYISLINLLKASLVYHSLCAMHFIGVGLRLSQAADSAEVSYTVASMTISIDAKCYYVLVFIRSRSTWGPLSQGLWFSAITSAGRFC